MSTTAPAAGMVSIEALVAVEDQLRATGHELRASHAANLALRERLRAAGVEVEAPDGVVTLARLRALEDAADLAIAHLNGRAGAAEAKDALLRARRTT